MKNILKIFILFTIPTIGFSQENLTVEDAISYALKHNYDIQISTNSVEQAKNNKSLYNSGYLPSLTASGNGNYSNNNTILTSQAGVENEITGAETKAYGGSIGINYILFNGGSRKYNYNKLKQLYSQSDINRKIQIENTLLDVYTSYYNVARNQEQKKTIEDAYKISTERLERVIAQQKYGKKTKLDVLNAKVDANSDSLNLLNITVLLQNNSRNLNYLLGREINKEFSTNMEVHLDPFLDYRILSEQLKNNNSNLKLIKINQEISKQELKINQAGWLPSISASASYGVNNNDNGPAGFFATQQSNGINAGINLSWNLFDGGTTKVRVQNAKINLKTQELNNQKLHLNLENQLAQFWAEYNTQKVIIKNEKINVEVSNQNFLKSQELFNLGRITSLDFRQAQLNLVNTKLNLLNAKYNAKLAELQLKKFAGLLK